MHAVWTLPPGDIDYPGRWKAIKIAFAKTLPKTERLTPVRAAKGERGIWQRRYWEHRIRDEPDYAPDWAGQGFEDLVAGERGG